MKQYFSGIRKSQSGWQRFGIKNIGVLLAAPFLASAMGGSMPLQAAEGMWLPSEQPSLVSNLPLKSVVRIGPCSGVFVSNQGLLLTNAHCIEDTMQLGSTLDSEKERVIREQGFLARDLAEELPAAPGFFASVTLNQEDVTEAMLSGVTSRLTPTQRHLRLTRNRNALLESCDQSGHIRCQVQEHQDGLQYLLIRERWYRDVRLVYVPPAAVASFGGDEANWQWPRFAADIAVLRVYTDAEGASADYHPDNLPLQPEEYAQVADSHLTFFDTVRVAGYPGVTQRVRTAAEMQWAFSEQTPAQLQYLKDFHHIIDTYTADNRNLRVQFQPVLFRLMNQITFLESQLYEYQRNGTQRDKEQQQVQLIDWLVDPEREPFFSQAWWTLKGQLATDREHLPQQLWWQFLRELSLPGAALLVHRYAYEQSLPADIRARGFQSRDLPNLLADLDNYANRLEPELEQQILTYLLLRYQQLPTQLRSPSVDQFFGLSEISTPDEIEARVAALYAEPELLNAELRKRWLTKSLREVQQSQEPWLAFANLTATERLAMDAREIESRGRLAYARPKLTLAQKEFDLTRGRTLPANANRTLRVSEGQVFGFKPDNNPNNYRIALTYLDVFHDHLEETQDDTIPQRFRQALTRHGQQCFMNQARGSVTVNYITSADGTAGSSGSPTFDTNGHLVGLVFDQMAESALSEWVFQRDRHRLIHVDARYLLWILGYYEEATELLTELGFRHQRRTGETSCRVKPLNYVAL
ncbi:MAG: S46 family peptidase [Idiomarina sp.]|nr:S46 family peptidase [Idiomarina sp.]